MKGNSGPRVTGIALVCVLFLLPALLMILGSLRDPTLVPKRGIELIPEYLTLDNYRNVSRFIPLWTFMRNSLFVVIVAVPLTVLVASWAGFAIARGTGRARRVLVGISLAALMVPVMLVWVPRFVMFKWLGLLDSPWPLIAPALMATSPFYVLLFALVYSRLPRSLFEAAEIDGMSPLTIWRRVAFPLARPAAFAVAVLAFVWHWSNFFDPLIYLSTTERFTLPLGLKGLSTLEPRLYPLLLAGAVIATVPALLAFLVSHRALFKRTLELR